MKVKELIKLNHDELVKKENDLREELFKLRFQQTRGQLTNTSRLRSIKKDIARVLTLASQKVNRG